MHIILWILKFIGILLAVILGLLLFVALIILLVPVRYRLKGVREPDSGKTWVKGKVSWLASVFSVTFGYEENFSFQLRIFGIPLKLKRKKAAEEESEEWEEPEGEENNRQTAADTASSVLTATSVDSVKTPEAQKPEEVQISETAGKTPGDAVKQAEAESKERFLDRLRNIRMSFREKLRRIPDMIRNLGEKIRFLSEQGKQLKETANLWLAFLKTDEVRETLKQLWKQVKGLARHILPYKIKIHGRFGFDDPALTGQVTGIISVIPAFYAKDISVVPDFTRSCLEGEFFLKGRIRAGNLLVLGLKILLDSNVRKVYKNFKEIQARDN